MFQSLIARIFEYSRLNPSQDSDVKLKKIYKEIGQATANRFLIINFHVLIFWVKFPKKFKGLVLLVNKLSF